MISEEDLRGETRGDITELRVYSPDQGAFIGILDLLASGVSGITSIESGGGLSVSTTNGAATITGNAECKAKEACKVCGERQAWKVSAKVQERQVRLEPLAAKDSAERRVQQA